MSGERRLHVFAAEMTHEGWCTRHGDSVCRRGAMVLEDGIKRTPSGENVEDHRWPGTLFVKLTTGKTIRAHHEARHEHSSHDVNKCEKGHHETLVSVEPVHDYAHLQFKFRHNSGIRISGKLPQANAFATRAFNGCQETPDSGLSWDPSLEQARGLQRLSVDLVFQSRDPSQEMGMMNFAE